MKCANPCHGAHCKTHPQDKVPVALFRKYQNDPRSHLLTRCLECRNKVNESNRRTKKAKLEANIEVSMFVCRYCFKQKCLSELGLNKDGTNSKNTCSECRKQRVEKLKTESNLMNVLRYEFISTQQCSCMLCKSIFLVPLLNSMVARELVYENGTYNYDNVRYSGEKLILLLNSEKEDFCFQTTHLSRKEKNCQKFTA